MIGPLDDLPVHQTAEPIASALPSRDFGERYRFVGWVPDGSLLFAIAVGLWPNREVIDGAFTVVRDGIQRSVLASRRVAPDHRDLVVGPLTLEVVEPMQHLRMEVDGADLGLSASLDFRASAEPQHDRERTHGTDLSLVTQFGAMTGLIRSNGTATDVDATAVRHRSWGIEPVGERPERGVPLTDLPSIHTYALDAVLPDRTVHRAGSLDDIDVTWLPGRRWPARAVVDGFEVEPVARLLTKGLGDLDPAWTDGAWKGDDALRTASWTVDDVEPGPLENLHALTLARVRTADREGTGVLDLLALGPHEASGLKGWTD